jgi:uncharacterized protein involved in type VI secretion and phage assembly
MGRKKGDLATLIAHVAVGQPLAASARAAGMSLSTAQRRLREPATQAAIAEAYADHTRQTAGRFRDLRTQALDRLGEYLAGAGDPKVVLRAAELALRYSAASDNAWVVEMVTAQLSAVEEAFQRLEEDGS